MLHIKAILALMIVACPNEVQPLSGTFKCMLVTFRCIIVVRYAGI